MMFSRHCSAGRLASLLATLALLAVALLSSPVSAAVSSYTDYFDRPLDDLPAHRASPSVKHTGRTATADELSPELARRMRGNERPLYEYVARNDSAFAWHDTGITYSTDIYDAYVLNMTSQIWLTADDITDGGHVWTHKIVVLVPRGVTLLSTTKIGIYVTKGHNGGNPDDYPDAKNIDIVVGSLLATKANAIVAVLFQIPNQSLRFVKDPQYKFRSEDALVAYTWRMAFERKQPEWAIYFPMTKAVVKAMDALTQWSASSSSPVPDTFEKYFISGASKRGAASWLVGAYEGSLPPAQRRVVAVAPQVFSAVNMGVTIPRIYQSLGNWTFALEDYWVQNVTDTIGTPDMDYLMSVVDPVTYFEELKRMNVLAISATGDEFFFLDDDLAFWTQLEEGGRAHRLMLPSCEHTLATRAVELVAAVAGYMTAIFTSQNLPHFTWQLSQNTLTAAVPGATPPSAARMFGIKTAKTSPQRRDFRMIRAIKPWAPCTAPGIAMDDDHCIVPYIWSEHKIKPVAVVPTAALAKYLGSNDMSNYDLDFSGVNTGYKAGANDTLVYSHSLEPPADGTYLAFFFEFQFPVGTTGQTLAFTTQVRVVPDTLPFPPCGKGSECHHDLV